jgi:hypothetical protein
MLSFTNVYFFESGLFNGLQPIQIKNPDFLLQAASLARQVAGNGLGAAPFLPSPKKRDCDPTIPNGYHRFRLMARFCIGRLRVRQMIKPHNNGALRSILEWQREGLNALSLRDTSIPPGNHARDQEKKPRAGGTGTGQQRARAGGQKKRAGCLKRDRH